MQEMCLVSLDVFGFVCQYMCKTPLILVVCFIYAKLFTFYISSGNGAVHECIWQRYELVGWKILIPHIVKTNCEQHKWRG